MSRILTLQRQARELGRLRTGTYDERPRQSPTWVVSSHSQDYVEAAASVWGGTVEKWQPQGAGGEQWRVITDTSTVEAILPPGDPLTQAYEMWSKGGCVRRCDGFTEQLTDASCLCRAKFGDQFHEANSANVCSIHSRLNVILPAMPDIGYWRAETKSYWAANELAGAVDTVRGLIGPEAMVPIRLRIEQRTRVAKGKTKSFPVVVLELRGITAGEVLAGAGALPNGGSPGGVAALSPGQEETGARAPVPLIPDYLAAARAATSLAGWREVWNKAKNRGHLSEELRRLLTPIGAAFAQSENDPPALEPVRPDRDPDDIWADIVRKTPEGWTMDKLENDFAEHNAGTLPGSATTAELEAYLALLANR
jgi:hypothetical protein